MLVRFVQIKSLGKLKDLCDSEKPAGTNKFVKVPGGEVKIGKPVAFPSYGWDNEYGELVLR